MGQLLIKTVLDSDKCRLAGVVDRAGHDWIGRDIGAAMGGADVGIVVTDDATAAFSSAQAVIDFSAPAASVAFSRLAAKPRSKSNLSNLIEDIYYLHSHNWGVVGLQTNPKRALNPVLGLGAWF